ncbi:MAG: gamma carbonic anhydrase family protein [Myxococcales bacterium]|nr:gamma carbonic anhydrase family protein [Myxococcales bacterium]MCB9708187.1 gamma carbonic anhydrase family protein [Myxococcales bacterium]
MRTIVDSVALVDAPPAGLSALEAHLAALRTRHPGATIERYLDRVPQIAADVYLASSAVVVGAAALGEQVSLWHGVVVRGDVNRIEIRARSNIQDGSVVHVGDLDTTLVEEDVVVGHRAVLHGCHIEAGCLIGIQATVLDGATVGAGSIVGAGSVVTSGTKVPARSLVLGVPGKVVGRLTDEDERVHRKLAAKYIRLAHNYRHG